ncbi:MAG TPA: AarF/UbiB family protein, partial [Lacipirellulaceae bacterium]|nr:AarF/UbiB family protein [Lacipirellulaceae bacterium]
MDWHALLDAQELAQLLPAEYARYAEPVCEGLAVFLGGLPEQRQQELAARQVALRPGVTLAERLGELAHQCPVLHKLGQSLARDPRLECLPSTVTVAQLQQAAERALGPLKALDLELEGPALAEASVAVVVPFRRRSAPDVRGVLKLLKHGVEPRLECELELLARVGAHLDEQCDRLGLPAIDYRERFEEISEKLVAEIQFEHEQRHLELAQRLYANDAHVQIPRLYRQWCTPRATAMERLEGKKVTDHALVGAEAARLGSQVTRALVSRPLLAAGEEAIFHCDPHAGNLMLAPDGRLAVLDWGLVSHLTEEERAAMTQLLL